MKPFTHSERVVRVVLVCRPHKGGHRLAPKRARAMATRRPSADSIILRTGTFVVPRELAEEVPALAEWATARAYLQVVHAHSLTPLVTIESEVRVEVAELTIEEGRAVIAVLTEGEVPNLEDAGRLRAEL